MRRWSQGHRRRRGPDDRLHLRSGLRSTRATHCADAGIETTNLQPPVLAPQLRLRCCVCATGKLGGEVVKLVFGLGGLLVLAILLAAIGALAGALVAGDAGPVFAAATVGGYAGVAAAVAVVGATGKEHAVALMVMAIAVPPVGLAIGGAPLLLAAALSSGAVGGGLPLAVGCATCAACVVCFGPLLPAVAGARINAHAALIWLPQGAKIALLPAIASATAAIVLQLVLQSAAAIAVAVAVALGIGAGAVMRVAKRRASSG